MHNGKLCAARTTAGALLAVGSPGSRVSQGRIDVFCIANGSIVVLPVNKKAISGSDQANDSADHRGHSRSRCHGRGCHASSLSPPPFSCSRVSMATVRGPHARSSFGHSIAFVSAGGSAADRRGWLLSVGAPFQDGPKGKGGQVGNLPLCRQAGAVHIFALSARPITATTTTATASNAARGLPAPQPDSHDEPPLANERAGRLQLDPHAVMHGTVTAGGLGYRMLAIHPLRLLGDPAKNHSRSRGPQAAGHPSSHLFLVSQPFARGSPSDEQQYEAGLGAILLLGDGLAAWLSALALLFCLCCNACGRLGARHLEHGTPPVRKPKQLAHPGGGGAAHMLLLAIATSTAVGFLALCTLRLGDTLGHEIGAARLAPKELVGAVFVFDASLPPGRVSTAAAVAVAAGRSGPNGRFGDGLAASWVPTASGGGKLVLASGEPNAHDSSADDASGRSNSKPWQQAGETWISQHFLG